MHMPETQDILEFANALAIGGTERQFVNLARGLDPSRFRVHVGTLAQGGQLAAELERADVPMVTYRIHRLYGPGAIRQQARLVRYLRRHHIQLIHTHGFYANSFALPPAFLARTPVRIASIRDDGSVWTSAQRAVERLACRLADCTVVNAEAIRTRLLGEGWPDDGIAVIPNGVDLARFRGRKAGSDVRRELGLPANTPIVGVLARLAPCKGLEFFLEACGVVADRFPDARFLIIGDQGQLAGDGVRVGGDYRQSLQRQALRLGLEGRVVFAGFRLDVPEILAELSVSVLPSVTGEGLPNSVLESMAAGLPVVATRSGGTSEAVVDGATGLLVPPSNAGALADAIVSLMADGALRTRLGQAGRQRVEERFSLERMTRDMQALYTRLLERRRRHVAAEPQVTTP